MTIKEFNERCDKKGFIDYDGFCYPVKDNKHAMLQIYPSERHLIPDDATHIVWFNR